MSLKRNLWAFIGLCALESVASAPRSAIVTLSLPTGARPLGMGEAGLAIGEDVFASSWNPASLALSPLSDEWRLSLPQGAQGAFKSLASKAKSGFLSESEAWASDGKDLWSYHAGKWNKDFTTSLEGKSLRSVIRTFVGSDADLDAKVAQVKSYNGIDSKTSDEFIGKIKLPWSLVLKDSLQVLKYDERTGYLWAGTSKGLYRFDGRAWKNFAADLGDRSVLALAHQGSTLWVGTNDGLFRYQQQNWTRTGLAFAKAIKAPAESAPVLDSTVKDSSQMNVTEQGSQTFPALAWDDKNAELWVAVQGVGIARLKNNAGKDSWKVYNTVTDSVIDAQPHSLVIDDSSHIWVGHNGGLSHFNRHKWSRIEFEDTQVNDLSYADQALWLATNKGMWRFKPDYFKPGAVNTQENAQEDKSNLGSWEHYHSGTGMISQNVYKVNAVGSEIWASTGAGIEHFSHAKRQMGLFNENLLPALNIPDLLHMSGAMSFPLGDWGTLGAYMDYVSFGEASYQSADQNGPEIKFNSYEMVGAVSYGLKMFNNNALGANLKLFYSNLMSGIPDTPDATTLSYAFDLSYLGKNVVFPGVSVAAGLYNMGPSVYYVDKNKVDPIPLTWRLGLGYDVLRMPDHRLVLAADYNREVLSFDQDLQPDPFYISAFKAWKDGGVSSAMFNVGAEYTWDNWVALRSGYMFDRPGQREEISAGVGVMISDVFQVDVGMIVYDLMSKGVREGQWRASAVFRY